MQAVGIKSHSKLTGKVTVPAAFCRSQRQRSLCVITPPHCLRPQPHPSTLVAGQKATAEVEWKNRKVGLSVERAGHRQNSLQWEIQIQACLPIMCSHTLLPTPLWHSSQLLHSKSSDLATVKSS